MRQRLQPGQVRDAILSFFSTRRAEEASTKEIHAAVTKQLGSDVPTSSVRSYLQLNAGKFRRVARGKYRLVRE
jgi:site-specific DNA-methyltransferase (adenine-specific)